MFFINKEHKNNKKEVHIKSMTQFRKKEGIR